MTATMEVTVIWFWLSPMFTFVPNLSPNKHIENNTHGVVKEIAE